MRLFLASLAAGAASILPGAAAQSNIETPRFEVVLELNGAQIRDYAPMIVAEIGGRP